MQDQLINKLTEKVRRFADERDWEQFHSPKNLSMALSVEVAELLEEFQWLTEELSQHPDQERFNRITEKSPLGNTSTCAISVNGRHLMILSLYLK
jgi:hypothetical protein